MDSDLETVKNGKVIDMETKTASLTADQLQQLSDFKAMQEVKTVVQNDFFSPPTELSSSNGDFNPPTIEVTATEMILRIQIVKPLKLKNKKGDKYNAYMCKIGSF